MTFTYLFSQVKYFITWFRKFTLCKASKNDTNCVETETPKWTWDMWQKDFDPSLHKNMSPFWWTKKRGLFLPPSLPYGPMSPSQQFFFFLNASLTLIILVAEGIAFNNLSPSAEQQNIIDDLLNSLDTAGGASSSNSWFEVQSSFFCLQLYLLGTSELTLIIMLLIPCFLNMMAVCISVYVTSA